MGSHKPNISPEDINLKCVGRGCSIKKTCLRYQVYNNPIYNENGINSKVSNITVNACTDKRNKDMFIPVE